MTPRLDTVITAALLAASAGLLLIGDRQREVNLDAVMEVWGDVWRDADQFGLRLARVSDEEEMRFGAQIAHAYSWQKIPEQSRYVTAVGRTLAPYLRRKAMRYEFHALASDQVNAFALPGGQIFVLEGMLKFLHSEAELAAILGHEMSHVDLKHCIERRQYQLALKKVGAGGVGWLADNLGRLPLTVAYRKYQEDEADLQGVRLSIEADYDPRAGAAVFARMKQEQSNTKPRTAAGELGASLGQALGSYFDTHPPSQERLSRLQELVGKNNRRLRGRQFYRGAQNLKAGVPRAQQEFPGERYVM